MRVWTGLCRCIALLALAATPALAREVPVTEVPAATLLAELNAGTVSSEALVKAYRARIAALDRKGPALHAVIALNPDALAQARQLDAEQRSGHLRGPLHGLPILVKDNIETRDPVATTAGSLALAENVTGRDAPAIARLRAAGAVVLGKTNLSEWANGRDSHSLSSWSGIGGLTRNPYVLDRSACGSSGGTGAAIAASFAAVGLGTETDGSVTCPAAFNGLVGLKPTVGLVSRTHVIPITHSQDTIGVMGRDVRDVALVFSALVGSDPNDPVTRDADVHVRDFAAALSPDALKGVRLGVLRPPGLSGAVTERFEAALARLLAAGAELVPVVPPAAEDLRAMRAAELDIFEFELKADLDAYLKTTPPAVKTRSLEQVIAFNKAHADRELELFGQDVMEAAEARPGLDSPAYLALHARALAQAKPAGLDMMLRGNRVAALVTPTFPPAYIIDPAGGGTAFTSYGTPNMPAIAGYPHLTVPMGLVHGLPVGLSFIGPAYADGDLLRYGYAFEARGPLRRPPSYLPHVATGDLLDPLPQSGNK